ncbi:MAG: hypothetical protein NTX86_02695 [Candidatus Dependentiae bacterium]|nr:hypothetical protein [Candidatus Dependentiae bacterium]
MKYIKMILLYSFLILTVQSNIFAIKAMGEVAATTIIEGVKENLPAVVTASTGFGYYFGVGALEKIGEGVTATVGAVKSGAVAVKAAAIVAAPYVAVGTGAGVGVYVAYKVYRSYHPTLAQMIAAEEEAKKKEAFVTEVEFGRCLSKNQTSERNPVGVPMACQSLACRLALAGGSQRVDKTMNNFTKYAPQ